MKHRCLLLAAAALLSAPSALARNWYVGTFGLDSNAGTYETPFKTIQHAIDVASDGDAVLIRDGAYGGPGNRGIHFSGKAITVRSLSGAASVVIDCGGVDRGFVIQDGETASTVIGGVTIANGKAGDPGSGVAGGPGGGIAIVNGSSPTIQGCIIENCSAGAPSGLSVTGGGAFIGADCHPTFTDCVFQNCQTSSPSSSVGGACFVDDSSSAAFTRCTFTGNGATATSGFAGGGAIYAGWANLTLTDCTFTNNTVSAVTAAYGGAIRLDATTCAWSGCTFTGNNASGGQRAYGGAVAAMQNASIAASGGSVTKNSATSAVSSVAASGGGAAALQGASLVWDGVEMSGNTTSANLTSGGAAVLVESGGSLTLTNASVKTNAVTAGSMAYGGGVMAIAPATVTLLGCTLSGNSATGPTVAGGGAVYIQQSGAKLTVERCAITVNTINDGHQPAQSAQSEGGGVYIRDGAQATLSSSLLAMNSAYGPLSNLGGGMAVDGDGSRAILANCTVAGNKLGTGGQGGGVFGANNAIVTIYNAIVWGNLSATGKDLYSTSGAILGAWYSDIGGAPATPNANHDFGADPRFVDGLGGNYHLTAGSPAIDAGASDAPILAATDLDGNPRVFGKAPDLGAYEFIPPNTFYVDGVNGSDANPGTAALPFKTVGKALSLATQPGTRYTLIIAAGHYDEHPHIAQSIRLTVWNNKGQVVIGKA